MSTLGRLTRISNLATVWAHEAYNFTPWLAEVENLGVLSDALGVEIIEPELEKRQGNFRSDIVAQDGQGSKVIIENQLGSTDHDHLGKLLTYAGGEQDVSAVVWIAARIRDEHRAALDWLNDRTTESVAFFGVEIELWKIDDGPPAPRFSVVCRPNDWVRAHAAMKSAVPPPGSMPESQLMFWRALCERADAKNIDLRMTKPHAQPWYQLSIGRTGCGLYAAVRMNDGHARVDLNIGGDLRGTLFNSLKAQQREIEDDLGFEVIWRETDQLDDQIRVSREDLDFDDPNRWQPALDWILEKLSAYDRVFRPRVVAFNSRKEI